MTGSGSGAEPGAALIADSAIAAARAGAAIVHCHVRDPESGVPSRPRDREVTERIRDADVDVVLNLTAGMGGLVTGPPEAPLPLAAGTDMISAEERTSPTACPRSARSTAAR